MVTDLHPSYSDRSINSNPNNKFVAKSNNNIIFILKIFPLDLTLRVFVYDFFIILFARATSTLRLVNAYNQVKITEDPKVHIGHLA